MKNTIDDARNVNGLTHIMFYKLECRIVENMPNIFRLPCNQIIQRNHLVPMFDQAIGEV